MKRFHVNVSVQDIAEGVRFYSALFATEPTVRKPDYAKWMLEDPRVNFSISQRGAALGVNHLGFQVDSGEELSAMRSQLSTADARLVEQNNESCCYAKSDKYWVTDPSGVPWETFHTLEAIPIYGVDTDVAPRGSACCTPGQSDTVDSTCCKPQPATEAKSCCAAR